MHLFHFNLQSISEKLLFTRLISSSLFITLWIVRLNICSDEHHINKTLFVRCFYLLTINILNKLISAFIFIINKHNNNLFKDWCLRRKYDVCFNYGAFSFLREAVKNFKLSMNNQCLFYAQFYLVQIQITLSFGYHFSCIYFIDKFHRGFW
jgi:hypothetical protein